ncbi:MAG: haloacid dehalogenase [Chloroflexi bacterium]|nr:haloacid dehalogenase [Chloroflexota bacterium]
MDLLDTIAENIHQSFETRTKARDQALEQTRMLIRYCANAIRAVHREDQDLAQKHLKDAADLAEALTKNAIDHPDFYYAGYTQDALKEYAEAHLTYALINGETIPRPEELNIGSVPYIKGMAETSGELRRRCLDMLRRGRSEEAERILGDMDDIYAVLVTMDYPNAITGGLRRQTDIVRSITERTRGDLTLSLRQEQLEKKLQAFENHLAKQE